MKKLIQRSLLAGIIGTCLFSCVSNKKLIYMQELEGSTGPLVETSKKYPYKTEDYLLQVNDIIEVKITTTNEEINNVLSAIVTSPTAGGQMGQSVGDIFFMNGYTLDEEGKIEIPLVGILKLEGLTADQAKALIEKGYKIISGGTANHCMLIDLRSKNLTGKEAEKTLGEADITVNKNMVPFDDKSPFVTSGIRIGTPAITSRGLKEKDCLKVVEFIDAALKNKDKPKELAKLKSKINTMMSKYPLFKD